MSDLINDIYTCSSSIAESGVRSGWKMRDFTNHKCSLSLKPGQRPRCFFTRSWGRHVGGEGSGGGWVVEGRLWCIVNHTVWYWLKNACFYPRQTCTFWTRQALEEDGPCVIKDIICKNYALKCLKVLRPVLPIELSSVLTGFQMFPTMFETRDITSLLKVTERKNYPVQSKCTAD